MRVRELALLPTAMTRDQETVTLRAAHDRLLRSRDLQVGLAASMLRDLIHRRETMARPVTCGRCSKNVELRNSLRFSLTPERTDVTGRKHVTMSLCEGCAARICAVAAGAVEE